MSMLGFMGLGVIMGFTRLVVRVADATDCHGATAGPL